MSDMRATIGAVGTVGDADWAVVAASASAIASRKSQRVITNLLHP
jgi:hypothetical protein